MSFQFKAIFSSNLKHSASVYCVNSNLDILQGLEKELSDKLSDCIQRVSFEAQLGNFLSLFPLHNDRGYITRCDARFI